MNTSIFLNQTGTIGVIYNAATQNITGSEFITLLGLVILIMAFFMLFNFPLEGSAILILPMLIIFVAYSNDLIGVLGVLLIYVAILLAKNWLI